MLNMQDPFVVQYEYTKLPCIKSCLENKLLFFFFGFWSMIECRSSETTIPSHQNIHFLAIGSLVALVLSINSIRFVYDLVYIREAH